MNAIAAVYRCLLRLYPRGFSERFGDEIAEGFARGMRARATRTARARYLAAAVVDLPRALAAEWWRLLAPPPRSSERFPSRSRPMDMMRQDFRDAVRSLRQRPGFVVAVAATLALGIGANAAVVTLVDAVLLRPLPIPDAAGVVAVFNTDRDARETSYYGLDGGLSYSSFRALEASTRSLSGLAGFIDVEVGLESDRGVQQVTVGAVSGQYFGVLGLRPAVGRFIGPADDRKGAAEHVVVLGDALWAREFNRDPRVVNRTVRLGGTPFKVIGVAPPRFRGTRLSSQPELWVPMTTITALRAGGIWLGAIGERMLGDHPLGWVATIGRLADGVMPEQATAELRLLADGIRRAGRPAPAGPGVAPPDARIVARPIVEAATLGDRRSLVRFVAILSAVVGLTLLIACMNVANLAFVRSSERGRELAVRSALGASRVRLMWMLLVEYLVLAGLGGIGAVAVGVATLRLLATFTLPGQITLDLVSLGSGVRMLAIALVLAAVVALLIGLVPAIRASAPRSSVLLRSRGAGRHRSPQGLLVVGQVALTVVLLVGAMLFVRSLRAGLDTDLGFDPAPLAAVSVDLFRYGYDAARAAGFYDDAQKRVAALPGVSGVALATHVPLSTTGRLAFDAPMGRRSPKDPLLAGINTVTADYFEVVGMPLVAGRTFAATDRRGQPRVTIVNESAARALFGDTSPVGMEIRVYGARASTVIGVVRDAKYESVRDTGVPMVYEHLRQELATGGVSILVRSADPAATLAELRSALLAVDPAVATYGRRLVAEQVEAALMTQRFGTMLLGLFAIIALSVAAVGIYSVVACTLSQRASELSIRVALGAMAPDVLRVVLGRSGVAVATGAVLGLAAAAIASRALDRFLFAVEPLDRLSFGVAGVLLAAAAAAAMLIPARRAVRTDPLIALRLE